MKKLSMFILFGFILGCNPKSENMEIQGDIYIKLINIRGSLYGMSEDYVENSKKTYLNEFKKNELSEDEILTWEYYRYLIKMNLHDKPYFKLKTFDGNIVGVLTNEVDYLKLKPYLKDLDRDQEKISVVIAGEELKFDLFFANKIEKIEKKQGKTDWSK